MEPAASVLLAGTTERFRHKTRLVQPIPEAILPIGNTAANRPIPQGIPVTIRSNDNQLTGRSGNAIGKDLLTGQKNRLNESLIRQV